MAAPSATTSFTFAPKQKQKQSARHPKQNGRVGGGRNHGKTEARGADRSGGNEDDGDNEMGPESDEEEIVVCSFGHSSKVVDAWMKKATQGWKEADMRADRKQNQAAEAFSNIIAGQQPDENSTETARRIGSRAGLGAEVASRKRKLEDKAKDDSRKRIFGAGGQRGGSHRRRQELDPKDPEGLGSGGGSDDDSDSEEELSRTSISKTKKVSSSQDSIIQMYKDSKTKPKKKRKRGKGAGL